jgi:hypothetical protein
VPRAGVRLALAVLAASCGVLSPEEQLLTRFFEASRLYDTTIVATMSSVVFNPRTDGVVEEFDVEDVREDGDSKRVTVRAAVRQLGGGTTERTLVFTLIRKDNRWLITAIGGP